MRRSKLETYEAILGTLMKKSLTVDRISYETDIACAVVNQRLSFLMENGLVEERPLEKKTLYAITERRFPREHALNIRLSEYASFQFDRAVSEASERRVFGWREPSAQLFQRPASATETHADG